MHLQTHRSIRPFDSCSTPLDPSWGTRKYSREEPVTALRSPVVGRRRLGIELRRIREDAGLTIEQVAEAIGCSVSKISRIESANVTPAPRDVREMLELYKIRGVQLDSLVQVAREARERSWWHAYRDARADQATYVDFEVAVTSMLTYQMSLVPGLLQTEEYARAAIAALRPEMNAEDIERQVELRMARQSLLDREDAPTLSAILDEAVLCRVIGGSKTMAEQLRRLGEAAVSPRIELQILPFAAGAHGGMDGAFTILGFAGQVHPDIVHLENLTSDVYLQRPDEIRPYRSMFDRLSKASLSPDHTPAILAGTAKLSSG